MAKQQMYLVGGAVRDRLKGVTPKDHDYVLVNATEHTLARLSKQQIGKDFPVFLLNSEDFWWLIEQIQVPTSKDYAPCNMKFPVEVALARTERSTGASHTAFKVNTTNVSLEQDLARRDLTINAIALSPDGTIVDPYKGKRAITHKVFDIISHSAFIEDPLRVLRVARMQANNPDWIIARQLVESCNIASNNLHTVSNERIWAELGKTKDWSTMFRTLHILGAFPHAFQELEDMSNHTENTIYHRESSYSSML